MSPSTSSGRGRLRWAGMTAALWASFQVAACESPTDHRWGDDGDDDDEVAVSRVDVHQVGEIVPGESVEVLGANLDQVSRITIDGQSVSFEAASPTSGAFKAPQLRDCDTDGRPVTLEIEGRDVAREALSLREVTQLEVGESRILSREELECLQLPGSDRTYAFSAASFTSDHVIEEPFTAVARSAERGGHSTASEASSLTPSAPSPLGDAGAHDHSRSEGHAPDPDALVDFPGSSAPQPFDDYASAEVGDTLTFVDYWHPDYHQALSHDEVPTYEAHVLAIEGRQMVLVDLDAPEADTYIHDEAMRERIRSAARMADEVMVPALQSTVHPELEVPDGASGRILTMIHELDRGVGTIRPHEMRSGSPHASGMFLIRLHSRWMATSSANAEWVARVMNHEAGHLADKWVHSNTDLTGSVGWYREAIAEAVADKAARLARGGERGVPRDGGASGYPDSPLVEAPFEGSDRYPAWGPEGSDRGIRGLGNYSLGGRILLYAQSHFPPGEAWRLHLALAENVPSPQDPSYDIHDRLDAWDVGAIADLLGKTREELLDEVALASITDDLLASGTGSSLPQRSEWSGHPGGHGVDSLDEMVSAGRLFEPHQTRRFTFTVPAGGYDYRYIETKDEAGYSLEGETIDVADHHRFRITRLR